MCVCVCMLKCTIEGIPNYKVTNREMTLTMTILQSEPVEQFESVQVNDRDSAASKSDSDEG